jgi:hypothetical protein
MKLDLLGFIESKNGKITRFDLVGKGARVAGNSLGPYPVAPGFRRTLYWPTTRASISAIENRCAETSTARRRR